MESDSNMKLTVNQYVGLMTEIAVIKESNKSEFRNIKDSTKVGFENVLEKFEQDIKSNEAKDRKIEDIAKLTGDHTFQISAIQDDIKMLDNNHKGLSDVVRNLENSKRDATNQVKGALRIINVIRNPWVMSILVALAGFGFGSTIS